MAVTSNMSINVSRNKRRAKSHVVTYIVAHLLYQLPTKVSIAFAYLDICILYVLHTMISYGYNHLFSSCERYEISELKNLPYGFGYLAFHDEKQYHDKNVLKNLKC